MSAEYRMETGGSEVRRGGLVQGLQNARRRNETGIRELLQAEKGRAEVRGRIKQGGTKWITISMYAK